MIQLAHAADVVEGETAAAPAPPPPGEAEAAAEEQSTFGAGLFDN